MENIDDIIDLLTETGGGHAVGEGNIKDAVVMLLQMKEAAAAPDPTNWQEKSRQLLAETEAETTRLLATKFVADEAVGLVGELVEALEFALGKLDKARDEYADATDLHLPCWTVEARSKILRALAKAAQFTAAGTAPTVGGASEPVIFPPGEVEAVPEYVPHWPGIPDVLDHVAVDKTGMVFAYVGHPIKKDESMWGTGKFRLVDSTYITEIPPPPGDTWQKMVYKRPE